MTEKVVRKTTAKKGVRRTASKTVPARYTVSKSATLGTRKAPVREPALSQKQKRSPKIFIISLILFTLVMGVSALIGFSDKGQLNVENAIRDRKQNATGAEQEALQSVPTEQSGGRAPNGGLVGMGQGEQSTPAPTQASTTTVTTSASSSLQTGSSTVESSLPPKEEVKPSDVPATPAQ